MPTDPFRLDGRTALITGVATGLGQAMAVGLARAGAAILGVHHHTDPTDAAHAVAAEGGAFTAIRADLGDPASAQRLADAAGPVDILINNAGIIRRCDLPEFTEADWDDVMNVNLKSLFFLSQAVARAMIREGRPGKIIHIASMLSFQGGIRVSSYTAAKHGVMGLTRSMANELAPHRINVNAIAPGYMATENTRPLREDARRSAEILARIPAGRWGEPQDLQGAAVFLASPAANYLHGITLPIDGGWLAR